MTELQTSLKENREEVERRIKDCDDILLREGQ